MSLRATMNRALAMAMALVVLAPTQIWAVAEELGLHNPPDAGTDGYICYTAPIDPPRPAVAPQDDSCRKDILVVALPLKIPPTLVPAPAEITVHYRTIAVDRPVGYVPVQDGVLTVRRGATSGQTVVQLRPSQLPEERFILEIFRPSMGTIANARVVVTIKQRG